MYRIGEVSQKTRKNFRETRYSNKSGLQPFQTFYSSYFSKSRASGSSSSECIIYTVNFTYAKSTENDSWQDVYTNVSNALIKI